MIKKIDYKWILLFLLLLVAFIIDLIIPDPLPFVDEIILGLLNILVAKKIFIPKKEEQLYTEVYCKAHPEDKECKNK